jgi:hypothetical protein
MNVMIDGAEAEPTTATPESRKVAVNVINHYGDEVLTEV